MTDSSAKATFDDVIAAVRDRLSRNVRIRRSLPGDGRLRLDRQLPFLCVYRSPPGGGDTGTRELVTTEAAYLFASGEPEHAEGLERLCCSISETLREHFGALLIVELWASDDQAPPAMMRLQKPAFRIAAPPCDELKSTVAALEEGLREVRLHGAAAEVETVDDPHSAPPGMAPLQAACDQGDAFRIGIAVRPIYRDAATGALFPLVLQSLRRQLATALRKSICAFTGHEDDNSCPHYESFGPSAMAKASRLVDQQLCEISQSFDFLLQVTPVNSTSAWEDFKANRFRKPPVFYYRPLPHHPSLLKRKLYEIPIEHVEDATLAHLYEEKQDELDKQLAALKHIDSPAFYYESLQLYGAPDAELVRLAKNILKRAPADKKPGSPPAKLVSPERIVEAAREHIDFYHQRMPAFNAAVDTSASIASALMVAHDRLLVSDTAAIPQRRVQPLLHHEVGVHLLTYFNGQQQPLRQLYAGLAGYEAMQEGLAVLSEYFVGGLTHNRLRKLAARVLAVQARCDDASFVDAFQMLRREHGLRGKTAFTTTLRVYRSGGLTKDLLYLKGLRDLLAYLGEGHDLEPLFVGKFALEHINAVQELRRRGVIQAPALLPRYWEDPDFHARLERCRSATVLDLLEIAP